MYVFFKIKHILNDLFDWTAWIEPENVLVSQIAFNKVSACKVINQAHFIVAFHENNTEAILYFI